MNVSLLNTLLAIVGIIYLGLNIFRTAHSIQHKIFNLCMIGLALIQTIGYAILVGAKESLSIICISCWVIILLLEIKDV